MIILTILFFCNPDIVHYSIPICGKCEDVFCGVIGYFGKVALNLGDSDFVVCVGV